MDAVAKRLWPYLHHNPEVASAVLGVFLRALRCALRSASPGAPRGCEFAALSFPQRFGSSLNAHFHFHVLALDGVFSEGSAGSGEVVFHEATLFTPESWQRDERTVQRRVLRLFNRRALLEDDAVQEMLGWRGSGGFSVDASVRIEGHDRAGVERLIRYCARPPLALERLHAVDGQESLASSDARLLYHLSEGDVQGRSAMRILALVTEPPTVQAILLRLGLPQRPPPLTPARGPPQREIEFDDPSFDPLAGDGGPDFDFDQSLPDDFGA